MATKPRVRLQAPVSAAETGPDAFLDGYLPYLLGVASYVMNRDFHDDVKAAGLSPLEWRTLATLSDKGGDGITVGELCRKVVSLQPAQTKAIKRLDGDRPPPAGHPRRLPAAARWAGPASRYGCRFGLTGTNHTVRQVR